MWGIYYHSIERKETGGIEMMTIPRRNNNTIELNSQQVRSEVLETVGTEFELQVNGYKYKPNGI
jgi:hypothetical protein